MKTLRTIFSAVCCGVALTCAAAPVNPITRAMLDGYEELLAQNPNDYLTLYEMSAQYYRLDDYEKALSGIKRAISCTPAKEKEQLASEYQLMADIYTQLKQYTEALEAVDKALALTPASYALQYMRGNTCLYLERVQDAKASFLAMQRIDPRGSEALFGLARVAAMEGKKDMARQYLADAEKMSPGNYLTYCRLGDVHRQMGMNKEAASDYLNAFSLNNKSDRPLSSFISLSEEDYTAVEQAVDYALSHTANVVPLYFLQASAANSARRYGDAYDAYRQLMGVTDAGEAQSLSVPMAEVCLHLGRPEQADTYATQALTANEPKAMMLKAMIEKCRGNYQAAGTYIENMLRSGVSVEALMLGAETAYMEGDYDKTLNFLNQAIMEDAEDARPLLFRGYVQAECRGDKRSALADYTRAAQLPAGTPERIVYKAIAQQKAGMALDAPTTIATISPMADTDARSAYLMALYQLSAGNHEEARALVDKARNLGEEDEYMLKYYSVPVLSISPIR